MSQRLFSQGNLDVFCGYDRPLNYFFLVIERHDASDDDPDQGYVFSNLRRRNAGMTLDEISTELTRADIVPPPTLMDDLAEDARLRRGNYRVAYEMDGGGWVAKEQP